MKTLFEHIEHVKGKPHHVRKQVAFGVATTVTSIIALAWLATSLGTGAFALKPTSFSDAGNDNGLTVTDDKQIAGVGAASILDNSNDAARIEIVDTSSSKPSVYKVEQTTIPF